MLSAEIIINTQITTIWVA